MPAHPQARNASRIVANTQTVYVALQRVKRAADTLAPAVEHMGVDHGGAHVLVAEQLLDGTDVVACLQQMSGEGVPKGVAPHVLDAPVISPLRPSAPRVETDGCGPGRAQSAG